MYVLTNAWKQPVMNYDGSRQANCSMHVDQRQWRRGHPMFSIVSPAQQDLRKTRNADNAVVQCSRQDRWCFSGRTVQVRVHIGVQVHQCVHGNVT